jgi:hypothetical protein
MRRSNLLLSVITSLVLVGVSVPSKAVPYGIEPTNLGSFGFATDGLSALEVFTNANVAQGPGGFTNTFQFQLTSVAVTEFASATNNDILIGNFTIQLFQAAAAGSAANVGAAIGVSFPGDGAGGPDPNSQTASQSAANLAIGFYNLVITGIAPTGTSQVGYSGLLNLSFVDPGIPEIPIPGAAWLFASGLLGVLVLSRTRRKTQTPQA